MERYWLTPPKVYKKLDEEFHFDFDPCPYPKVNNGLVIPWGKMNYVNPPFRKKDGFGAGPTAFVRKAIEESTKGNSSFIVLPVQSYVNLLLESGAKLRSLGRIKWIETDTHKECKSPSPICGFFLPGKELF